MVGSVNSSTNPSERDASAVLETSDAPNGQAVNAQRKESEWEGRNVAVLIVGAIAVGSSLFFVVPRVVSFLVKRLTQGEKYYRTLIEQQFGNQANQVFQKIDELKGVKQINMMRRFALSDVQERQILDYLHDNYEITSEQLEQIFKGAHVRLADDGQAYEVWKAGFEGRARKRISSHPADATQYGMDGKMVGHLLFSRITAGEKIYSFFQLERHGLHSPESFVGHAIDYILYRLSGENQGPEGSSPHRDNNPLILQPKPSSPRSVTPISAEPSQQ